MSTKPDKIIFFTRRRVYFIVYSLIIIGAIIPFAAQFILPLKIYFKTGTLVEIPHIEIWNQFVSMILGIVATVLSIVSLKMCFDSADDAKNTEMRTTEVLHAIEEKIAVLTEKQDEMKKSIEEKKVTSSVDEIQEDSVWGSNNQKTENKII